MAKTHWKKFTNPDYLGAYSLDENETKVLTIRQVKQEMVTGNNGKKEECEKQLSSISSQAQDIILEAKNEGEKIKEKKIAEADEEIANKKEELRKEIEQEKIRANDEIRKTIIDVAIGASSKILEREVSSKDNEYLIDEFIKEVGSNEQ